MWKQGDLITAVKLEKMAEVCRRVQMAPGYFSSGPLMLGVPSAFGSSSSRGGGLSLALLIKNIDAAEAVYDGDQSYITHGYTANSIIPLPKNDASGSDAASRFEAEIETVGSSSSQRIIHGLNPVISCGLYAGNGKKTSTDPDPVEYEEQPLIVVGYEDAAWEGETVDSGDDDLPTFIIQTLWYPFSISYGTLTADCTGGLATVNEVTKIFGLKLAGHADQVLTLENPHMFDGPAGGWVVLFRACDGTKHVLDMECMPDET